MVCLIKGICHGKHYHAAHIAAVLSTAWSAGVERIIVACIIIQVRHDEFCLWSDSNLKQLFLDIFYQQESFKLDMIDLACEVIRISNKYSCLEIFNQQATSHYEMQNREIRIII